MFGLPPVHRGGERDPVGMMADASDECMLLTRFMDRDTFDVGCVHVELQKFHDRINHLFLNKACLTCDGYTKVALEFLKRPRVLETVTLALTTSGSIAGADKARSCRLWLGW